MSSKYIPAFRRLLGERAHGGVWQVEVGEFSELLGAPKSYKISNLDVEIIAPALGALRGELGAIACEKLKRGRGNRVVALRFYVGAAAARFLARDGEFAGGDFAGEFAGDFAGNCAGAGASGFSGDFSGGGVAGDFVGATGAAGVSANRAAGADGAGKNFVAGVGESRSFSGELEGWVKNEIGAGKSPKTAAQNAPAARHFAPARQPQTPQPAQNDGAMKQGKNAPETAANSNLNENRGEICANFCRENGANSNLADISRDAAGGENGASGAKYADATASGKNSTNSENKVKGADIMINYKNIADGAKGANGGADVTADGKNGENVANGKNSAKSADYQGGKNDKIHTNDKIHANGVKCADYQIGETDKTRANSANSADDKIFANPTNHANAANFANSANDKTLANSANLANYASSANNKIPANSANADIPAFSDYQNQHPLSLNSNLPQAAAQNFAQIPAPQNQNRAQFPAPTSPQKTTPTPPPAPKQKINKIKTKEVLELFAALAKPCQNSTNSPKAAALQLACERAGLAVRLDERFGALIGEPRGAAVVLVSHIDLIDDFEEAFAQGKRAFKQRGKKIIGALDNTLTNAAALLALGRLARREPALAGRVALLFSLGEEGGADALGRHYESSFGVRNFIREFAPRGFFINLDVTGVETKMAASVELPRGFAAADLAGVFAGAGASVGASVGGGFGADFEDAGGADAASGGALLGALHAAFGEKAAFGDYGYDDDLVAVLQMGGAGFSLCLPTKNDMHCRKNRTTKRQIKGYVRLVERVAEFVARWFLGGGSGGGAGVGGVGADGAAGKNRGENCGD